MTPLGRWVAKPGGGGGRRAYRSWWPLLAVAVLLVLAGGAAAVATPQLTRVPVPDSVRQPGGGDAAGPTPTEQSPVPAATEEVPRPDVPGWLLPVFGGILLAIVVGGLLVAVWLTARGRLRSRPGQVAEPAAPSRSAAEAAEEVVAAVDAGLSDLSDTDLDPRRAVIACWVRLEQVAAAAGTPRRVADTPADLVTRLLSAHDVDPAVLAEFADIYRHARYTTHTVDERMRGQARAALERVRAELTGAGREAVGG
jgi:hypothetical protein